MKAQDLLMFTHSLMGSQRRRARVAAATMLPLGLAGILAIGGCNKTATPPPADTASATPPPAAAPSGPASAPPAAAAPAPPPASAPAPPPPTAAAAPAPPPPPRQYRVPAGTRVVVRIGETISAKKSNVGDSFSGTLSQSVVVNGVNVIRAGAPVTGTVTAAKGQGRFKGNGDLAITINRIGKYDVATSAYETDGKSKGKRSAAFIGGGGGGGALIGGIAGGGKGALLGGLLGAGAGTAGAAFTGNKDITVPAESVVTFSLTSPFTVTKEP